MKIRWLGDITGLDLEPEWEVSLARIHTVKNMVRGDTRADTMVLYVKADAEQYARLCHDYGKENIPSCILGLEVFVLEPNAVLWVWQPPKGYEGSIKPGTYTAVELVDSSEDKS